MSRFEYGICSVCHRRFSLTKDGKITPRHAFCAGAGKDPLPPDPPAGSSEVTDGR
jgi:hypothetical protein